MFFYCPKRSCECYVFTGVCLSTGGEGVSASVHGGIHPPEQTPPPRFVLVFFFGILTHSVHHKNHIWLHFILRFLLYLGGRLPSTIIKFDILRRITDVHFITTRQVSCRKIKVLVMFIRLFGGRCPMWSSHINLFTIRNPHPCQPHHT